MFFLRGHSTRRVYLLYDFTKFQQITPDSHLCPHRLEARAGGEVGAPSGVVRRIPGGACRNSGATISPCLFFWHAAGEVVEERGQGRALSQCQGATAAELRFARTDTSDLIRAHFTCTRATDFTTTRQAALRLFCSRRPFFSIKLLGANKHDEILG